MGKTATKEKFGLVLILLLGLGLRLVGINQSFWLDEASQAQLSALSPRQIWNERGQDFHPPLFYLLAHTWMQYGQSEAWLRLLPISFGVITIGLVYIFGKKLLGSTRAGLIAAFLLAINPYLIYYSQEFRMYSLLALLGTWAMYLLITKSKWLFIANALLLYTHYSSVLLILAQLVYIVWFYRSRLLWLCIQFALTVVAFLPWVPGFIAQLSSGSQIDVFLPGWRSVLTVPTLKSVPLIIFKFMAGRITILPKLVYGIYIVFVLFVTFVGIILAKQKRPELFVWLIVPILSSIFLSLLVPQTQPFRLLFTLPALILILTQACMKFPKLFFTLLIYISVVGNLMYFTRVRLQREQWRQAIHFLVEQNSRPVVKFSDKFAPFYWYAPDLPVYSAVGSYPAQESDVANRLHVATLGSPSIFLLEYLTDLTDPSRKIEKVLTELGYSLQQTHNFEGVGFIYEYRKP